MLTCVIVLASFDYIHSPVGWCPGRWLVTCCTCVLWACWWWWRWPAWCPSPWTPTSPWTGRYTCSRVGSGTEIISESAVPGSNPALLSVINPRYRFYSLKISRKSIKNSIPIELKKKYNIYFVLNTMIWNTILWWFIFFFRMFYVPCSSEL